jgi:chromosome segregation ATPase
VEFWEGPVVRGYRTDSGDPAYVKEIHGFGWYGIKMVGSFGGRNRRVHWKSMYKDGTFQKKVGSGGGSRVRTKGRMQERAKEEAEAKLGEILRETKRELTKAGRKQHEIEKNAEDRLKGQEMEARKAEKDLTASHKRQLHQMTQDNSQGMQTLREDEEEKERKARICIRDLRKDIQTLEEDLGKAKEGQADLLKQISKDKKKVTSLIDAVDSWKDKHAELNQRTCEREERLRVLKMDMAETGRDMKTLEKRVEREDDLNKKEVALWELQRDALAKQLRTRNEDVRSMEQQIIEVCYCVLAFVIECKRLTSHLPAQANSGTRCNERKR